MASNVLCLVHDGQTFFTLSSKGPIGQLYPSPTTLTDYDSVPTVKLRALFTDLQISESQKIPRGYVWIRDDADQLVAVDYQQLLQIKDVQSLSILTEEDWTTVIEHGKTTNTLQDLRSSW
jgi:hypothetical protein